MPKFLFECTYSAEGLKGVVKDKASGRRQAISQVAEAVGGRLDAVYWALGDNDAYVICDLPDIATAAAVAMTVSATGLVHTKTVPILTVEETDKALSKTIAFRPPGR
jgi:uncharacterized protein with GYD domain